MVKMNSYCKKYKVWRYRHKTDMTYDEVCHELGFIPECKFVKITTAGTITFTCGTPDEVWALFRAVKRCGFTTAKGLERAIKYI